MHVIQNQIKFLGLKLESTSYKVLFSDNYGKLKVKRFCLNQKGLQKANIFIEELKKCVLASDLEKLLLTIGS